MRDCRDPGNPCRGLRECIGRLEFVRSNGLSNQEATPRRGRKKPAGDCAVIALSLAAGLTYRESRRRLAMLEQAIRNSRSEIEAMGGSLISYWDAGTNRDPSDGVSMMNLTLIMKIHEFRVQDEPECLAGDDPPRVTAGTTENGMGHVIFTARGQTMGTYDPTRREFQPLITWKRETRPNTSMLLMQQQAFGSQERMDRTVRAMLRHFTAAMQASTPQQRG